nr:MAG TPA: hypothetical protein [Caudoviricetes sp.]DAH64832.1 MAG TPA: hypothetical protein [Caudoviricetes sp.]
MLLTSTPSQCYNLTKDGSRCCRSRKRPTLQVYSLKLPLLAGVRGRLFL